MNLMENFHTTPDPDFESAFIAMGLAHQLLKDRQYKLGREMVEHAMGLMAPESLSAVMHRIYRNFNDRVLTVASPLADMMKPSPAGPIAWK